MFVLKEKTYEVVDVPHAATQLEAVLVPRLARLGPRFLRHPGQHLPWILREVLDERRVQIGREDIDLRVLPITEFQVTHPKGPSEFLGRIDQRQCNAAVRTQCPAVYRIGCGDELPPEGHAPALHQGQNTHELLATPGEQVPLTMTVGALDELRPAAQMEESAVRVFADKCIPGLVLGRT
jgi:hypothetical protein